MVVAWAAYVRILNYLGCCIGLVHHKCGISIINVLGEHNAPLCRPISLGSWVAFDLPIALVDEAIDKEPSEPVPALSHIIDVANERGVEPTLMTGCSGFDDINDVIMHRG